MQVETVDWDYKDSPCYRLSFPNGWQLSVIADTYNEPGDGLGRLPNEEDKVLTVIVHDTKSDAQNAYIVQM